MSVPRIAMFACFAVLLAVPLAFRPDRSGPIATANALSLIIITPHNEQIRYEFAREFDAWHQRNHGAAVNVVYNVPGGTSEIRKMLQAQFAAAIEAGREPGGDADLVFGGGSFEHGQLKRGVRVGSGTEARDEPISQPVHFDRTWLNAIYGENRIGDDPLYDEDMHWFGTALSGFGIIFNRDMLRELQLDPPATWMELCQSKLYGQVALVNPGQSGSITTAFDAILKREGWRNGWRILRRAGANARYFSGSSLKPPIDVSQGNAAVGICIDFFGRYQVQAMKEAGDAERIGYIDPPGGSTIDADPISMLRNAPHPEVARRFIEFCLSEEGQALWQFPRRSEKASTPDRLGPQKFELRRMPIARSMYRDHIGRFIDQVNPYDLATPMAYPNPNYRDFIAPMFAAMVMDNHAELKSAWRAITNHRHYPREGVAMAENMADPTLHEMLELFDAMPLISDPEGRMLSLAGDEHLAAIRSGWLKRGWARAELWHRETRPPEAMRKQFGAFFAEKYRQIVALSQER